MRASLLHGIIFSACPQVHVSSYCPAIAISGRAVGIILQDQGCGIFPTSYPCPRESQVFWNYGQGL